MIVYKITNLINGKIYVGQSLHDNSNYFGSGIIIKTALKKYGKENFVKEVLCVCDTVEETNRLETYWITTLSSTTQAIGYNIANGGLSPGYHSDETLVKLRESNIGRGWFHLNKEERFIRLSEGDELLKLGWIRGRCESPLKGKKLLPLSDEQKLHLHNVLSGRKLPPRSKEHSMNISKAKMGCIPHNKGKHKKEWSDASKLAAKRRCESGFIHPSKGKHKQEWSDASRRGWDTRRRNLK